MNLWSFLLVLAVLLKCALLSVLGYFVELLSLIKSRGLWEPSIWNKFMYITMFRFVTHCSYPVDWTFSCFWLLLGQKLLSHKPMTVLLRISRDSVVNKKQKKQARAMMMDFHHLKQTWTGGGRVNCTQALRQILMLIQTQMKSHRLVLLWYFPQFWAAEYTYDTCTVILTSFDFYTPQILHRKQLYAILKFRLFYWMVAVGLVVWATM